MQDISSQYIGAFARLYYCLKIVEIYSIFTNKKKYFYGVLELFFSSKNSNFEICSIFLNKKVYFYGILELFQISQNVKHLGIVLNIIS